MPCRERPNVIHHRAMALAPDKDETKALAREVGQRAVGQLEAGLARVMGESGANSRWLLGALVLLNGGGIAVAASLTAWLDPKALESAISFFVIGAALAVLAALAGAFGALMLSRQIGEASALWTQVASSGDVTDAALKAAGKVRQSGQISALATLGMGLLSLILFVAAAMTMASGLAPSAPPAPEPQPVIVPAPPQPAVKAVPAPAPAANASQPPADASPPKSEPAPQAKAPPPKPEPKQAPRRAPRQPAEQSAPAPVPSSAPPAAAAPAPAQPATTPN
jgi:hypothetical protein